MKNYGVVMVFIPPQATTEEDIRELVHYHQEKNQNDTLIKLSIQNNFLGCFLVEVRGEEQFLANNVTWDVKRSFLLNNCKLWHSHKIRSARGERRF